MTPVTSAHAVRHTGPLVYGSGVSFDLTALAVAAVAREGASWRFDSVEVVTLSQCPSALERAETANGCWRRVSRLRDAPQCWLAVRDPWGIVAGVGRDNKGLTDARRLTLLVGQVMQWAIDARVTPCMFEASEIRKGLGAAVDSDIRRLGRCVGAVVKGCPEGLNALSVEALATAVMGGRFYMAPSQMTRRQAL